MARPIRIEFPDAWHHVFNTSLTRRPAFSADAQCALFLQLVEETAAVYGISCHSYCLLPNRYDLLIHTPKGNLSQAMRHLNSLFTQRLNAQQKQTGPICKTRYKSVLLDESEYLLKVSRYIHQLPALLRPAKNYKTYPHSSYRPFLNKKKRPGFNFRFLPSTVASDPTLSGFKAAMTEKTDENIRLYYEKKRRQPILGDSRFQALVQTRIDFHVHRISIADILNCVKNFHKDQGITFKLSRPIGKKNLARLGAMYLCRHVGGHSLRDIANAFELTHYSTVSASISRFKKHMSASPELSKTVTGIEAKLKRTVNT